MRRTSEMLVFLAIVLTIYGLVNWYIGRRGWQALTGHATAQRIFFYVFLFLVLTYPLSRMAGRVLPEVLHDGLSWAGALFMSIWFHAFFVILIIDVVRLLNRFFGVFPRFITRQPQQAALVTFMTGLAVVLAILLAGFVNARNPRIRTLDISIDKGGGPLRQVELVVASDIHLSPIFRNARLEKIVRLINALGPDAVLLPGDTVDMEVPETEEEKMTATLGRIRAPLGVFAVPGNHEYYGGLKKNMDYLRRAGVTVLEDASVKVGDSFYFLGRNLRPEMRRDERKPLREILEGLDTTLPLILIDHVPAHLEEAEQNGIDLQISGHTHAGQLIPLNFINMLVWEKYWGYLRKGRTQYYISCGVGTWGMPVRTGSIPEIVRLRLKFR